MTAKWMLWLSTGLLSLALTGCGKKPETELPTYVQPTSAYVPQANSQNAFDDYALAALSAEQLGGSNLTRVNFFPGHKAAAEKDISAAIQQVARAVTKPCSFKFVPTKPSERRPYVLGWRLIGRVFSWQVDDAVKAGDMDTAINQAVMGTTFGFDLTGGDAVDASLGLSIVDDLRRSLMAGFSQMTSDQLNKLAAGMQAALARRADTVATIENERQTMMEGIQNVQDRFKAHELGKLQLELGSDSKDGIDYLASLEGNDKKIAEFFDGFSQEGRKVADWGEASAKLPTRDRPKLDLGKGRTWWRISRNYFGTIGPLLSIEDATIARTRLLIVTAQLTAMAKKNQNPSLTGLYPLLVTDPYSGKPFVLHSDGLDFSVYSVGPNLKDDGGDSDSSFTNPDLVLEQPR